MMELALIAVAYLTVFWLGYAWGHAHGAESVWEDRSGHHWRGTWENGTQDNVRVVLRPVDLVPGVNPYDWEIDG